MVSRSEIDMKRIKDEYKKAHGKTLYQDILVSRHVTAMNPSYMMLSMRSKCIFSVLQDDTKDDYEKILLALCGGEN